MKLHFAKDAAGRTAVKIQANGVRFVRVNKRTEVQLFHMKSNAWLAVAIDDAGYAAFVT